MITNNGEVLRLLTDARALIARPWGWLKGSFHGRQRGVDCYCAIGALQKVSFTPFGSPRSGSGGEYSRAIGLLADVVAEQSHHYLIPDFNDDPRTKKKDVLAVFDAAITRAKEAV